MTKTYLLTQSDFGSGSGEVCEGNDSRLSNQRTPPAHAGTHGSGGSDPITPASIGAEPAISTKNSAFHKSFGTAADTVCQGNDSRLSDARTPLSHTHTKSQISDFPTMPKAASVTLTVAGWSSSTQTVSVSGMTSSCAAIVTPDYSSIAVCQECEVYAMSQGYCTLTFACVTVPGTAVTFNIVIVF